jgi:hypothetical protein
MTALREIYDTVYDTGTGVDAVRRRGTLAIKRRGLRWRTVRLAQHDAYR